MQQDFKTKQRSTNHDEICKRSARFIVACLCSGNVLVKSVVNYGILARCHSIVGRNVMLLSRHYAWLRDQLVSGQLLLRNADFMAHYMCKRLVRFTSMI